MRFAYAGDRDIAVRVLEFVLKQGEQPLALLVPRDASHAHELTQLLRGGPDVPVWKGNEFERRTDELRRLDLDYLICVHFPLILPSAVLSIPKVGTINLHPAYLPYNRGWHTPSWSILEKTPAGATLHFMSESLDAGDIIHQREIEVSPADTAHSLYLRLKKLEFEVFVESWSDLVGLSPPRDPQSRKGTSHRKADLFRPEIQGLDLSAEVEVEDLLRRLRALSTDRLNEAAYFVKNGRRYRVRIEIQPDDSN